MAAAEVGWDGTVEELQALVASLDMAVAFSRSLTACMPVITQVGFVGYRLGWLDGVCFGRAEATCAAGRGHDG